MPNVTHTKLAAMLLALTVWASTKEPTMAKASTSILILNTLATMPLPNSSFTAAEKAALRRLAKKGLVVRMPDSNWMLTDAGIAEVTPAEGTLDEIVTAEGAEYLVVETAAPAKATKAKKNGKAKGTKAAKAAAKAAIAKANKVAIARMDKLAGDAAKATIKASATKGRKATKAAVDAKGPRKGTKANPVWGDTHPGTAEKTCNKCGEHKAADAFYVSYAIKDGLDHWCKACNSAWAKESAARKAAAAAG